LGVLVLCAKADVLLMEALDIMIVSIVLFFYKQVMAAVI